MRTPEQERFLELVEPEPMSGCWLWAAGYFGGTGYGCYRHKGAHRVSHVLFKGPIRVGLTIDHLCFNRSCVNPDHLEAVTQGENNRRLAARRTHCPAGHPFTSENTYVHGRHGRQCRLCMRAAVKRIRSSPEGRAYMIAYRQRPYAKVANAARESARRARKREANP